MKHKEYISTNRRKLIGVKIEVLLNKI